MQKLKLFYSNKEYPLLSRKSFACLILHSPDCALWNSAVSLVPLYKYSAGIA